jgi:hypothetical protein
LRFDNDFPAGTRAAAIIFHLPGNYQYPAEFLAAKARKARKKMEKSNIPPAGAVHWPASPGLPELFRNREPSVRSF